jgi:hypothetical protein
MSLALLLILMGVGFLCMAGLALLVVHLDRDDRTQTEEEWKQDQW